MNDEELKQRESATLNRLQSSEVHWHIVKTILVIVCCIITIGIVGYYSHQTNVEVRKNRHLISCALISFSPTNDGKTPMLINQCIRANQ